MKSEKKSPSLALSVCALLTIIVFVAVGYLTVKANFTVMLFACWLIMAAFTLPLGYRFSEIEGFAYKGAKNGVGPAAIIIAVGILIASFMAAGTVPTILALGLKVINPVIFLPLTFILCIATSLITGTSWGTIGTMGVAMIGVGTTLGVNPGMTAGAIISGAYFGDKMSPVSDSTILSSTLCGVELWDHIRNEAYTTIPGAVIALVLYTVIGFTTGKGSYDPEYVNQVVSALGSVFKLDIIALLPIIVVLVLICMKKSTIGAILIGAVVAFFIAVLHQGYSVAEVCSFLNSGFKCGSEDAFLKGILNRGGISSMMSLVGLIIVALGLGGIIGETGILTPIFAFVSDRIRTAKGLLVTLWVLVWICVILVPTYNFAFVILSTLFVPLLDKYGLSSKNVSRILEDVGTLGGNLFPWGVGAVYATGVLGVPTVQSAPFNFLCYIVPVISLVYILTGFRTIKSAEAK
ncbi:MAG: Na+/H+ antiporter NhaC family protein [Candidatus Ornithospirochaeta sp.]|nr:Na+/H+ antiporter NhaC family protein [Candidatus Ornithospirochaeta sp.]